MSITRSKEDRMLLGSTNMGVEKSGFQEETAVLTSLENYQNVRKLITQIYSHLENWLTGVG